MSDQVNAGKAEEQASSESGLLLSVESLQGGGRLSASGDDGSDTTDATGGDADASDDSDAGITDALGVDTDGSDADASDSDASDSDASDADASDSDGTDGGDSVESESGLGGENPLGIDRKRVKNGDDKDTRDT